MTRDEWVKAAVLELVNDGGFYNKHKGQKQRIIDLNWLDDIRYFLSNELLRRKPDNVLPDVKIGLLEYYDHTEPKKTTPVETQLKQEEIKMSTKVIVKTFVGNVEATAMTDDQIFGAILKEEQDIADMEKIQNKPKKLLKQIEERRANIAKLVELVDSRS